MSSDIYLPRSLLCCQKIYSEVELLAASKFIVILAEPGGGKTDLMNSLASQLGATAVTASVFGHLSSVDKEIPLVIDAFDELAKIDETGIHKLLGHARSASPTYVLISSRSSEWDNASTALFEDFLGQPPLVVRLREFTEAEQRAIFADHTPREDFNVFQSEVARFDLEVLLPNPQFLKLFADAFVESGRKFVDKRSIFKNAVERLAREANGKASRGQHALSIAKKVQIASEVFAKLLLSGAEGVSKSEASESRIYPLLDALVNNQEDTATRILATRLFKPSENADQHRPVHKIVSEYCAAHYLTNRISDPLDDLTVAKVMPIVAPNSTVRDELRGLLGWMASLGNTQIQEAAINLDPYAILANGDPSQLDALSKRLLVSRLKDIADQDPYFRRGDFRRRFSVAGFFTLDVVDEIRPLLASATDWQLLDLILELLAGSPAIENLTQELQTLLLSNAVSDHTRVLAAKCLLDIGDFEMRDVLPTLIFEASQQSLSVSAKIIQDLGSDTFSNSYLAGFFRVCANLYPKREQHWDRTIGSRSFIGQLIESLGQSAIEYLLDELTLNLACKCDEKPHCCDCRNGTSEIIGGMLDRYFELATPPHDPVRLWGWLKNLNFHNHASPDHSKSVKTLRSDDQLRQGVMKEAFGGETDPDKISDIRIEQFGRQSHSGLHFLSQDYRFMSDLAFDTDNPSLWFCFIATHIHHREPKNRGPDGRRAHMRAQAREQASFMKEWTKRNRAHDRMMMRAHRVKRTWGERRRRRKEKALEEAKNASLASERALIESGKHWDWLRRFADLYLISPDKLQSEVGSEVDWELALRSSFTFLDPYVPTLEKVALGERYDVVRVLHAACLAVYRDKGSLDDIAAKVLEAVKTDCGRFNGVSENEAAEFEAEIDRRIFASIDDLEVFIRRFVEPQLAQGTQGHTNSDWLGYKDEFKPLRPKLSLEWLKRFCALPNYSLDNLFNIAVSFAERGALISLIEERCAEFLLFWPDDTGDEELEQRRNFWFLRALYFLPDIRRPYFDWLADDKNTVLALYEISGRGNRKSQDWPRFSSKMVEALLGTFIPVWPKVPLPDSHGSDSPEGEKAYRFLTELVWGLNTNDPESALPVIGRLLADKRYVDMHQDLKSIRAGQVRKKALRDFQPPSPDEIVNFLDQGHVVTVEGLRQLVVDELHDYQKEIHGGEFNSATVFYNKINATDINTKKSITCYERKNENDSTERVAERLKTRLQPQGITINLEHQLKAHKRSDFTATTTIGGTRRLLVAEVKGQWHDELYTAAATQLYERYSIHPDAEQQGVYLVLWFGPDEKVAGVKMHQISSAQELKENIEHQMPDDLLDFIDVFVLDVSSK